MIGLTSCPPAGAARHGGRRGTRLAHAVADAFAADLLELLELNSAADFLKDAEELRLVCPVGSNLSVGLGLSRGLLFTTAAFEQDVLGALPIAGTILVLRLGGNDDLT